MEKLFDKFADLIRTYLFQVLLVICTILIICRLAYCVFNDFSYNPKPIVNRDNDEF